MSTKKSTRANKSNARIPVAPPPSTPSKLPWLVGGIVVACIAIIAVIAVTAGDDEPEDIAGDDAVATGYDALSQSERESLVVFGDPKVDGELPKFTATQGDPAIGQTAPVVTGGSTIHGEDITLEPGTPRMIVFAAHWCQHCQKEIPLLASWASDGMVPDGMESVIVTTDSDDAQNNFPPTKWLIDEGWTGPTLADSDASAVLNAYGFTKYPSFVWVDAAGKVTQRASGELTREAIDAGFVTLTSPSGAS